MSVRLFVCVCLHMHACRCTRLRHATVNAANTSGGSSPGPFVPSALWTTCQPAGRESKAARSGQWAAGAWRDCCLALHHRFTANVPLDGPSHRGWHVQCHGGGNSTKKTTAFPMSCWMCFRGTFFCAVNRHRGGERRSWPFLQAAFSGVGIGFCTKGNWFNCLSRNLIGLTLKPEGVSLSHRSKTGTNQLRRGWKMEQIQMKMHVVFILCYKLLIKKYTMYKWVHHSFPVSPQLF